MRALKLPEESWRTVIIRYVLLSLGALIGALQVIVFMVPADVAPGGLSGVAVILNELFSLPIGIMVLILNIPIQIIGYRMLGGWRVVFRTVFVLLVYSVLVDVLTPILAGRTLSDDRLLNALFGGVVGGFATGLVFRGGGTFGGTSTLARIIQDRFGQPMSSTFLYTDTIVIAASGFVFGLEGALYALVALIVGGITTDYALEGPSVVRTATIVTDHPTEVAAAILDSLERGVTAWEGRGMYTEQPHSVLFVTVARPEVDSLRRVVAAVDPSAFVVIGHGQAAYGKGFRRVT
ncbi:MAG: YitT family protein [Burkholderiales bacterium]|nr:YitT family protein [Anaerolineae bacterium]